MVEGENEIDTAPIDEYEYANAQVTVTETPMPRELAELGSYLVDLLVDNNPNE